MSQPNQHDFCDKEGAELLVALIKNYWARNGYPDIQLKVCEAGFTAPMRSCRFDVRSTLVNGLPPKTVDAARKAA